MIIKLNATVTRVGQYINTETMTRAVVESDHAVCVYWNSFIPDEDGAYYQEYDRYYDEQARQLIAALDRLAQ